MKPSTLSALLLAALAPGAFAQAAPAAPAKGSAFTRLLHPSKTTMLLQTRATRYVPADGSGPIVWLVGVTHIGAKDYYRSLEKLLDAQSLVLYEGVQRDAPADAPKEKTPFANPDHSTYKMFADAVGLDFQLLDIDYTRPTFHNSDLTWNDLTALSAKSGADASQTVGGIGKILDPDSPQGKMMATFLGSIKSDPGSQEAMRVVLVQALAKPNLEAVLGGATSGVIITARNEKVFGDLEATLKQPAPPHSIAVFYGAGHMDDLEARVLSQLHYKPTETRWFTSIAADQSKVSGAGQMIVSVFERSFKSIEHGGAGVKLPQ